MVVVAGKIVSAIKKYNKTTADLDPFGGRYTPQENRQRAASQKSFMENLNRNSDRSNNKSAGTGSYAGRGATGAAKGPTPEQQVASARAAEREAKIKKGKARRKKYEAAQTMAKKMKLIFVD